MKNNDKITKEINNVIEKIRPFLINDGGDVELIKFENGIAYVKMIGNCSNCVYSGITIKAVSYTHLTLPTKA